MMIPMPDADFDRGWNDSGGIEDRVHFARRRFRRRFIISRIIYLLLVIAGAVVVWKLVPQEVKDAVRNTYLNPDYDPLAEPGAPAAK